MVIRFVKSIKSCNDQILKKLIAGGLSVILRNQAILVVIIQERVVVCVRSQN